MPATTSLDLLAAREVGAQVAPECSLEFMALLPREIALAIRRAEGGR
mgnify:CR=1 FL=1